MKLHEPLNARELKARIDLAAIAGQFTRLRRSGHQLVGICPLHSERHPSFFVNREKQVWKCFGCGAGGDVFEFVMRATGCDFRRALEIVAGFSGVARASDPRSGSRFGASEGASPPAAKRPDSNSQNHRGPRARILAALDAANRRLRVIEVTNRKARAATATACEPEWNGNCLLSSTQRISARGRAV
jgi:hypothetical protein